METLGRADTKLPIAKAREEAAAIATRLLVAEATVRETGDWPRGYAFERDIKDAARVLILLSGEPR